MTEKELKDLLHGYDHCAIQRNTLKTKVKDCKYLGQLPVYRIKESPSMSIHRVPFVYDIPFIDKFKNLEYNGIMKLGTKSIPSFKEIQ